MQTIPHDVHGGQRFRVRTGHLVVTVQGRSSTEALRQARKKLCEEMPRLWDLIQARDDSEFEVTKLK